MSSGLQALLCGSFLSATRTKKEGRKAPFQSCDAPFVLAGNAMRQTHATRGSLPAYALRIVRVENP
jgi:hypothetical protein